MGLRVLLGERSYDIELASTYRDLPGRLRRLGLGPDVWVISHPSLFRAYGRQLVGPIRRAGWHVETVTVPEAEASKSLAQVRRLLVALSRRATMRVPTLLAFGGGVVGDLTGFVAAVFRRGIPYVQLPTTLLAQVDSAIGGKVGVDLPQAKNFVGAFYQPRLVWCHTGLLRSLPLRQRRSGLAEVIKYGVMGDAGLFAYVERSVPACLALRPAAVRRLVGDSARIKARVVSRDEREQHGVRATLNFGHTVGHAIEAATGYRSWTHGEAIAVGMCAASTLAVDVGLWPAREHTRLTRLLEAVGLPTRAPRVSRAAVRRAMRYDKKFIRGRPRWVLPTRMGHVVVTEAVPAQAVERALEQYVG